MNESPFNIVSIDIGYSNVKIATGTVHNNDPTVEVYPAYATTREEDEIQLVKRDRASEAVVYPEGNMWRVFTDMPDSRELHNRYHTTEMYLALYYGGLLKATKGTNGVIDLLVTGLPVDIANHEQQRAELTARLTGTFKITPDNTVTVKRVIVLAQGVGVINDILNQDGMISDEELGHSNILVVDPGFYSMDYVAFSRGDRLPNSSGTSLNATSVIIEHIVAILNEENPHEAKDDMQEIIEVALRNGQTRFFNGFRYVELEPFIQRVVSQVASEVVKELRKRTRAVGPIHIIAAAGGGTRFYEKAIRDAFPQAKVLVSPNPVASNAIGFWHYGVDVSLEDNS